MSMVKNGKISTNDQKVDKRKYDSGHDSIRWKSKSVRTKSQAKQS